MILVPFPHYGFTVFSLAVVGILTLFGRKKKEDKQEEPSQPPATPAAPAREEMSGPGETTADTGGLYPEREEFSLSRFLQSLQDSPPPKSEKEEGHGQQVTPNWLPPREAPPSRPMRVVPGEKGKVLVDAPEPSVRTPQRSQAPIATPTVVPVEQETFSSYPRFPGLEDEIRRIEEEVKKSLETPEKPAKQLKAGKSEEAPREVRAEKQLVEKRPAERTTVGFTHVFEATQGALDGPGFVLVKGPVGSGKTGFCSALAAAYLQRGRPCVLVAYDQSPSVARESLGKVGCEVSKYESQFLFLLVDAYSGQLEGFSLEPYYVERPFDLSSLENTLAGSMQIFMGASPGVVIDSLTGFANGHSVKEFQAEFRKLVDRMSELQATVVVTVDSEKVPKEFADVLESMAGCVVELEKKGPNAGRFSLRKLRGSPVKFDVESFEFDSAKGLVFV